MTFRDPIVGGNTLIRDAIKSPNYVAGVSGWSINRDGTAEFNSVTVRGDLILGTYPGGPYIFGDNDAGSPSLEFRDDTHSDVVFLETDNTNPNTTVRLRAGDFVNRASMVGVYDGAGAVTFDDSTRSFAVVVSADSNSVYMSAQKSGSVDLAVELDPTTAQPDGSTLGRIATLGQIYVDAFASDANYPSRMVDGRVYTGAIADSTSSSTTDVVITSANVQNTYVEKDFAYKATFWLRIAGSVLNDRAQFKLKNGTTQVGQDRLVRITGATATFVDITLEFLWRATTTETISNLNLTVNRFSGTGTITARVEADNYTAYVEKVGDADRIGSL
jgi:hypothetical protein